MSTTAPQAARTCDGCGHATTQLASATCLWCGYEAAKRELSEVDRATFALETDRAALAEITKPCVSCSRLFDATHHLQRHCEECRTPAARKRRSRAGHK